MDTQNQNENMNVFRQYFLVDKNKRAKIKNQKPFIIWLTGISGSGKSTIANILEYKLFEMGYHTILLDGDNVRHGLNVDLDFTDNDRKENIRRVGEASKLMLEAGLIVIAAFISPFRESRDMVRGLVEQGEFIEIYLNATYEVCQQRDRKGLYKRAKNGLLKNFTAKDSPYEQPISPEIELDTEKNNPSDCLEKIIDYLFNLKYLNKSY